MVNNAFHTERGHLTALVSEALSGLPVKVGGFFAGLGGADISVGSWEKIVELTGRESGPVFVHQGVVL